MAEDVRSAPNRTERPKVAVQSLAAFDVQHRCVCACGFRRSDICDRPGDADTTAGALSNSEQQRRHLESRPLCMGQLERWRNGNVVGARINRLFGLRLVLGRNENGIETTNHPAFASARQIELTFAVTFEKCRDTVIALVPKAKQHIVVAIERVHGSAFLDKPTVDGDRTQTLSLNLFIPRRASASPLALSPQTTVANALACRFPLPGAARARS